MAIFLPIRYSDLGLVNQSDYHMLSDHLLFHQEDTSADMATGPEKYRSLVVMHSDGEHRWYIPTLIQSSCAFNVARYYSDL